MESILDILTLRVIINVRQTFHKGARVNLKNRLEEIRKKSGMKQEELAAALEVSRQTIGSLENGRYNPSIILAFKIARFFGMSIEEIFIFEEEQSNEK
jgi:putative transcriptional regulator